MRRYGIVAVCLVVTATAVHTGLVLHGRARHVDDIREAVFRHQFRTIGPGPTGLVRYLAVGDLDHGWKDPDDRLMQRFRNDKPAVMAVSRHAYDRAEGVYDPESGKRGAVYYASHIKWLSDAEVEVVGGYYGGSLAASGHTYRVVLRRGRWVVTKDVMDWIS